MLRIICLPAQLGALVLLFLLLLFHQWLNLYLISFFKFLLWCFDNRIKGPSTIYPSIFISTSYVRQNNRPRDTGSGVARRDILPHLLTDGKTFWRGKKTQFCEKRREIGQKLVYMGRLGDGLTKETTTQDWFCPILIFVTSYHNLYKGFAPPPGFAIHTLVYSMVYTY